jgi:serine/threonine protein kinase/RNA polymerase subunit RPABC4/transcription elongation factor Spt4
MSTCPTCAATTPPGSNFCPNCGADLSAPSQVVTVLATPSSSIAQQHRTSTTTAVFAPGQVVLDRYRILGLLGRGGMGEVYRADDLKLGSQVALKFLPRAIERDPAALERFHAEVRLARQVSHPHVCRVYDIGEVGGRHFLSMEYVDGEDLATLLHRIGRLPSAKGIEIARQLCAGLAAAHDKGIVHRDLKPANVMIDRHGRARITDFGLAVLGEESGAEVAGTPAYMSPEQLVGKPATVQSDLYALGLVLYERRSHRWS